MRRHSAGLLLVVQPLHGFPLPFDLYCLLANQVIYGVVVEVLGSNVRNFLCASLFFIFLLSFGSVSFRQSYSPVRVFDSIRGAAAYLGRPVSVITLGGSTSIAVL